MKTPEDLLQEAGDTQRRIMELPEGSRPFGFLLEIPSNTSEENFKQILAAFGKATSLRCGGLQSLSCPGFFLLFRI